ncbi:MAG TPA: SIMPL domain-containing protein [Jatrophihabitans sp.]
MLTVARTTVPIVLAGLVLTACSGGGGKADQAPLSREPIDANVTGAVPNSAGTSTGERTTAGTAMGGAAMSGAPLAGAGMDAAASMNAAVPMRAAPPITTIASGDGHTITTRGVGRVSGTPDTLTVLIGVSTQDSSAKAALSANNSKANALIELLRSKGVADKDLQTRQLTINPTYNDKSGTITGYQVDNAVQATLHSIAGAGALLDAAAGVVGNAVRVQQIGFSIGDDSALRAEARAQAVGQAKAQAAQIAKAAGVTLGRIRSITEVLDGRSPITYDMRSAAGAAESVPLQPGQQELTVAVDIVYDMS